MATLHHEFDVLKELLKDDPQRFETVLVSERKFLAAEGHLRELGSLLRNAHIDEIQAIVSESRRKMNNEVDGILSSGLLKNSARHAPRNCKRQECRNARANSQRPEACTGIQLCTSDHGRIGIQQKHLG